MRRSSREAALVVAGKRGNRAVVVRGKHATHAPRPQALYPRDSGRSVVELAACTATAAHHQERRPAPCSGETAGMGAPLASGISIIIPARS